jgi:NADPH2:quinone reductase
MPNAIRIHSYGGPEVLQWEPVDLPEPGPDEVRLRHTAIGLNFIDIYERTGLYQSALPITLGREAAGVVDALGSRVKQFAVGDRVAYVGSASGSYSEYRAMPAERLVGLPEGIQDTQAAAMMLKGLTAQALLRQVHRVRKGETLLIHAAAGGVGLIAVQWAKHLGAKVIAVVSSESKAALVREQGADHVILTNEDLVAQVKSITHGRGVRVVYDSVGKDTFMASLDCLQPRGMMVTYGNASGPVPAFVPLELSKRGSLFLTRPTLFHYIAKRSELQRAAKELFELVLKGAIGIHVGQTFALKDAAQAHRALESRQTTGSTVLVP